MTVLTPYCHSWCRVSSSVSSTSGSVGGWTTCLAFVATPNRYRRRQKYRSTARHPVANAQIARRLSRHQKASDLMANSDGQGRHYCGTAIESPDDQSDRVGVG